MIKISIQLVLIVFSSFLTYKYKQRRAKIIINSYTKQTKKQNKMFYYPQTSDYLQTPCKAKQIQNYLLVKPNTSFNQYSQLFDIDSKSCEFTRFDLMPENIELDLQAQNKIQEDSRDSSFQLVNNQALPISDSLKRERQRKRKNKEQKNKQIKENHKDDGRGGNCIASNISKTLNRIVQSTLKKQVFYIFDKYLKLYKIKSQKQNTIILLLLLYVLAKRNLINIQTLQKILYNFFMSLRQSQTNCQKKMKLQQSRRNFHLKNKKMYTRFIQINKELYFNIRKSLVENSSSTFSLAQLESIISDTYDRKQRQIEKAMNKIKSIILNHSQLKNMFGYQQNDIKNAFFQSIDYAFRRNLPKRCKQIKSKVQSIFNQFEIRNLFNKQQDKYMICYMALVLINDKSDEIWRQFVNNLKMKKQFNKTQEQLLQFENLLINTIPLRLKEQSELRNRANNSQEMNSCKIQQECSQQNSLPMLYATFQELKNSLNY